MKEDEEEELEPWNTDLQEDRTDNSYIARLALARKNFYAGTFQGWLSENQISIVTGLFILAIIILSIIFLLIYIGVGTPSIDDEDCWPKDCEADYSEVTDVTYYSEPQSFSDLLVDSFKFRIPSPTNKQLNDVIFVDSNYFPFSYVSVGEDSTILYSYDGISWSLNNNTSTLSGLFVFYFLKKHF